MKVRNGFVSNSSSSSFCIMGILIEDLETLFNEDKIQLLDKFKEDSEEISELFEDVLDGRVDFIDITYGISDFYEQHLLGKGVGAQQEDETLGEFRTRTKEEILDVVKRVFVIPEDMENDSLLVPSIMIDGGQDS